MPRGIKKQINYDEEFSKIDMRITHHLNSIKELKEKRAELSSQQTEKELENLRKFLNDHNLTPQEAIELLSQKRKLSKISKIS